jgi:hypothetical protein
MIAASTLRLPSSAGRIAAEAVSSEKIELPYPSKEISSPGCRVAAVSKTGRTRATRT